MTDSELRARKGASPADQSMDKAAPSNGAVKKATWGRDKSGSWTQSVVAFFMLVVTPWVPMTMFVANKTYNGSLQALFTDLFKFLQNGADFANADYSWFPRPTLQAFAIYAGWVTFQFLLAVYLPGPTDHGQLTPAGHILKYKVNGWRAWWVTHAVLALCVFKFKLFNGGVVYDNWAGLFIACNALGYTLTFFSYFKALHFPSHPDDCKRSGSLWYDIYMGVELNPRFGDWFDFKLFFNGRPGIIAWSVINFSFMLKQYEQTGHISLSMVALNILHNIYILDFFWNEGWYLRTIDIAHDHFGYYLAWGDTTWLPFLYPLQSFYLMQNPHVDLSKEGFAAIMALGLAGYWIFRAVNDQKDKFRKNPDKPIWGSKPKYIKATFQVGEGKVKESTLLYSGFWGLSRHFNYVGDLMMSLSFCLVCGFNHLLPYFYIIYMTILLVHRVLRDDQRCREKYGKYWTEYCTHVKWRILPGVF